MSVANKRMNKSKRNAAEAAPLVPACRCEVTRRGPNWLFVHIDSIGMGCGLGDRLWELAEQQFVYRLVVEFDVDTEPDARLPSELRTLCDRLEGKGGALRLCGLAPEVAHAVLAEVGCPRLHNHASSHDAVWSGPCSEGVPPARPR